MTPAPPPARQSPASDRARRIATAYLDAANRHDPPAMAALWAPGAVEELPTLGVRLVAPGEIVSHFAGLFAAIPDVRFDLRGLAAEGHQAFALSMMSGTHVGTYHGVAGTGRAFRLPVGDFLTIQGNTIIHNLVIVDGLSILRQLGGFPTPDSRGERLLLQAANVSTALRRAARRGRSRTSERGRRRGGEGLRAEGGHAEADAEESV